MAQVNKYYAGVNSVEPSLILCVCTCSLFVLSTPGAAQVFRLHMPTLLLARKPDCACKMWPLSLASNQHESPSLTHHSQYSRQSPHVLTKRGLEKGVLTTSSCPLEVENSELGGSVKNRLLIPLHVELNGLQSGEGVSLAGAHVQVHLRLASQAVLRAPLDADLRHVSGSRARAAHLDRTLPGKSGLFVQGWTKRRFLGSVNPASWFPLSQEGSPRNLWPRLAQPINQYTRE